METGLCPESRAASTDRGMLRFSLCVMFVCTRRANIVQKIQVERVLRDIWQETKTPLMIYATETALNVARTPLSSQLQRFSRAENKAFHQELHHESTDAAELAAHKRTPGPGPMDMISPSKRKHRADSIDSMDSNRASIGSDDVQNDFYNPFEDGQTSTATMTASGTPAATTVVETSQMGADMMMTPASDNEAAKG